MLFFHVKSASEARAILERLVPVLPSEILLLEEASSRVPPHV